jgi:hypothetical protein
MSPLLVVTEVIQVVAVSMLVDVKGLIQNPEKCWSGLVSIYPFLSIHEPENLKNMDFNRFRDHLVYVLKTIPIEKWIGVIRQHNHLLSHRLIKDALMASHPLLAAVGEADDQGITVKIKTRAFLSKSDIRLYELGAMLLSVGAQSDVGNQQNWTHVLRPVPGIITTHWLGRLYVNLQNGNKFPFVRREIIRLLGVLIIPAYETLIYIVPSIIGASFSQRNSSFALFQLSQEFQQLHVGNKGSFYSFYQPFAAWFAYLPLYLISFLVFGLFSYLGMLFHAPPFIINLSIAVFSISVLPILIPSLTSLRIHIENNFEAHSTSNQVESILHGSNLILGLEGIDVKHKKLSFGQVYRHVGKKLFSAVGRSLSQILKVLNKENGLNIVLVSENSSLDLNKLAKTLHRRNILKQTLVMSENQLVMDRVNQAFSPYFEKPIIMLANHCFKVDSDPQFRKVDVSFLENYLTEVLPNLRLSDYMSLNLLFTQDIVPVIDNMSASSVFNDAFFVLINQFLSAVPLTRQNLNSLLERTRLALTHA